MRGKVWLEEAMKTVLEAGGRVMSPLPQLADIPKSYAIWYSVWSLTVYDGLL